ncbi:MAG: hypothetical protein DLM69_01435 [Candidatus Chloroheliales bacterium]|nr:MAG: hypothetical protein DLM69_01435 [Chloroflexota bacterium]
MQAAINNREKPAMRRKLHIGVHLEIGLKPVDEASPERYADMASPLERAYHRQQLEQQASTERDATYRRMRLG